ncbi:Crp/Fnr family transcriptional regulator [Pararcticibacter amylolyticus]|uniref:Cyclic nucleotide-binding domain-containing protein n=1 Tax=Pararcticibacter amylolyticus TaxID=2173175 RepID=A0A2U2PHJ5_9SPHI|nr:Crp/Fnr family transcriptional regulator [Pararcticibacter amylolyticus]PWG80888.1 hypothetical protein DDR33_10595 [Pararcticibacter amylolyticus]
MNTEVTLILEHIGKHIHLTGDEQDYFVNLLQAGKVKKRQFILKEGMICKHSSFVNKGCLRGFTLDKNGFEHVLNFAPPGWWIGDMYSMITQKPGVMNIQALEDTDILQLSKVNQEILCTKVPKFEHFFRVITENSLVSTYQRLTESLSFTAEERYLNFCKKYPMLIQTLPQKQIASYLGITPEFLSKMKKGLLKKR